MLDKARPIFNPLLEKIATPFKSVNPNIVTIVGFLSGFLFFYLIQKEEYFLALLSFTGILVDSLDGTIARMTGKVTKFGGFFDASLDRVTDAVMMMGFAYAEIVSWPLVTTTIIASMMISYSRAKAEQMADNKIRLAVGIIERPERIAILFLMTLMLVLEITPNMHGLKLYQYGFQFLLLLSVITILQRFYAAWKALKIS